jgi:hypothetical protein
MRFAQCASAWGKELPLFWNVASQKVSQAKALVRFSREG